jgi:hypothetical protein
MANAFQSHAYAYASYAKTEFYYHHYYQESQRASLIPRETASTPKPKPDQAGELANS